MADEAETIDRGGEISEDALNEAFDTVEGKAQDKARPEPTGQQASAAGEAETDDKPVEVSPPEHWSAEDKEAFLTLDETARKFALGRETQFNKGIEEKSLALKKWEEALKPYSHVLGGADPTQAVQRLLQAQAYLTQNPSDGLKWLAQSLNVDLKTLVEASKAPEDDDPYVDPEVKRLRQELKQAKDDQARREQQAQQRQQQQQFAIIQQFKDEKDADGNLTHPHFDELQPIMAGLLQSGRATDLDDAYGQAYKAHPEYIEKEVARMAEEKAAAEAKRKAEEAAKAEQAAKGPRGKTDAKAAKGKGSWEQDLEQNFEKSERGEL